MSQESNIDLEIQINTEEDEFLANIDFHLIEAAMALEQQNMNENNVNIPKVPQTEQADEVITLKENPRFVKSNKEVVDKFLENGLNKNTKFKTDQDIKLFQEFLLSACEERAILDIPPEELSPHVSNFLYAVRKKDGNEYEPNSLISKFQSISRYLNSNEYGYSLVKDQVFHRCRQVLKSKTKDLKSQGKGNNPNAASPITSDDIDKLYAAKQLGNDNPVSLQNSMWYICTNYFGMRTGTEVHSLCWGDVELHSDDDGTEYLIYSMERQTKTRTGVDPRDMRKVKPRAYEVLDDSSRCPVTLYKQFAVKRPATMMEPTSPFFLTVANKQSDKISCATNNTPARKGYPGNFVSRQSTETQIHEQSSSLVSNTDENCLHPFRQFAPAPRNPYDFLGGFFHQNQISGNINVHFHTSNMSSTSNSNVQAIMNSPPVGKKRRRILPIDSDSE